MKLKILVITAIVLSLLTSSYGALTYEDQYYQRNLGNVLSGGSTDPIMLFINEVEGYLEGATGFTMLYFSPQSSAPTSPDEGTLYYRDAGDALVLYTAGGWVVLDAAGASSLDTSYGISGSVTVDAGALTFTGTNAADNLVFWVEQEDTGSLVAQLITSAGTGALLSFDSNGAGVDILGSDSTWNITKAGVATLVGATIGGSDLTFIEKSATDTFVIRSDTLLELEFAAGSEDVSLGFGTSDTLTWTSDNGVDEVAWGDLDDHTGLSTLTFDAETGNSISVTGNAASEDLLIQQLGTRNDVQLILYSAGIGTDSLKIHSAKGIDIDAVDDLNIRNTASASGDDFIIRLEGEYLASLIISSDGTDTDALQLLTDDSSGSGDIDITSGDDIDINAADDITVDTADGSMILTAAGSILGDMTLSVADNFANTVGGLHALTVTGSSTTTITDNMILTVGGSITTTVTGSMTITVGGSMTITIAKDVYALVNSSGSLDFTATGANVGDMNLSIADDYTNTVGGQHFLVITGSSTTGVTDDLTLSVAGSVTHKVTEDYDLTIGGDFTLAVTGSTTLDEILFKRKVLVITASTTAVGVADSGIVFVTTASTVSTTFTLPLCAVGLVYTFVDISATAGDDLEITANTSDTINGGSTAANYVNVSDTVPASVTLLGVDDTAWVVIDIAGTWRNE